MLVKMFAHPKGGGGSEGAKNSAKYLEGKNKDREGAELLAGDLDLSVKIAQDTDFKNKYTVGCLSFEESDIPEKSKEEIMQKFEETIFAGLEKDQYNISWVQHTDKGRLELNFFIPNVELTTGKQYLPYFDKKDRPLTTAFQEVINHDYDLTNPNDPDKKQTLQPVKNLPKDKKNLTEAITKNLKQQIIAGAVNNRDDVVKALEKMGLEIARQTKKSISIKSPDGGQNIRLKGAIYEQNFRNSRENRETDRERTANFNRSSEERYKTANENLRERIKNRATGNNKKYKKAQDRSYKRNAELPTGIISNSPKTKEKNKFLYDNSRRININNAHVQPFSIKSNIGNSGAESIKSNSNRKRIEKIDNEILQEIKGSASRMAERKDRVAFVESQIERRKQTTEQYHKITGDYLIKLRRRTEKAEGGDGRYRERKQRIDDIKREIKQRKSGTLSVKQRFIELTRTVKKVVKKVMNNFISNNHRVKNPKGRRR